MKYIYGVLAALFAVSCQSTPFISCPEGNSPEPLSLRVYSPSECTKLPCKLNKDGDITIEVTFETGTPTNFITSNIEFEYTNVIDTIAVTSSNDCDLLTDKCPLKAGKTANYKITKPVPTNNGRIPKNVKFTLKNKALNTIVCTKFPVEIN